MYCKHCGKEIDPGAAICIGCGYQNGSGNNFCRNCGQPVIPGAAVCTTCGFAYIPPAQAMAGQQKSKLAAGLLGIFLGYLGVHNFYLGYTGKAVGQLLITVLTCGVGSVASGIWGLVEGIMILCDRITVDGKGIPLSE